MAEQDTDDPLTPAELQQWLDTRYPTRKNKKPLSQQEAEYIIMLMENDPAAAQLMLAEATRERSDQQGTSRRMKDNRPNKLGDTTDKLANLTVSAESARQDGVGNVAGPFAPFSATRAAQAESSISMTIE
jgi:hypothetical protein